MKIVHLPGFASIFAIATGLCKLPPTETSISGTIGTFEPAPQDGGVIYHVCKPAYYFTIGSYDGGSLVALENSVKYCCNNSTGNFQTKDNTTIVLTTVACAEFSQDGKCGFTTNGTIYIVYDKEVKCPAGKIMNVQSVGNVRGLQCSGSETQVILLDNDVVNLIGLPEVECVPAPTTSTSTTASTSTSTRTVSTTTVAAMPGCAFLPVPTNLPWTKLEFNRTYLPGGRVQISCDKRVVGNFGEIRGNVTAELTSSYTCDPAIGKWISETGVQTALKTMACTDNYAVFAERCYYYFNGHLRTAPHTQVLMCPLAHYMEDEVRGALLSITCLSGNMYGTYPYKATFKQTDENGGLFRVKCPSVQE